MKKITPPGKVRASSVAGKTESTPKAATKKTPKTASVGPKIPRSGSLPERMAVVKKYEAAERPIPAPKATKSKSPVAAKLAPAKAPAALPQRNSNFPNTYIREISVRLEDPDHPVTLTWTGSGAGTQETGPFRSSPGAGLRGLNCNLVATSRRSGSTCTPKGTFTVTGFAAQLNSHPEAKDVTWFVPARGIAFHYYPSVPKYAASHGCVRLETRRGAQLIKNNSRAGITRVVVDGTWTKPPKQY